MGELKLVARVCSICKVSKPIFDFHERNRRGKQEKQYKCKECNSKYMREWKRKNKHKSAAYARTPKGKFSLAVSNAKSRKLVWDITQEQYLKLTSQNCVYCEGALPEAGIGLDRLDNSNGYSIDNVVPCCQVCNTARGNFWTPNEMQQIGRLFKTLKQKRGLDSPSLGGF